METERGKRNETLHEINPVENINKNPKSFFEKTIHMSDTILLD